MKWVGTAFGLPVRWQVAGTVAVAGGTWHLAVGSAIGDWQLAWREKILIEGFLMRRALTLNYKWQPNTTNIKTE